MPAKDLGTKYTCFKCGSRFYDLKKPEPICPKCGADQRQATRTAPPAEKRVRRPPRPPPPEPAEVEAEADEAEADEEAEEPDDDEA
jgi:uncharacterized protein (TIGR02300 family)